MQQIPRGNREGAGRGLSGVVDLQAARVRGKTFPNVRVLWMAGAGKHQGGYDAAATLVGARKSQR